ncbi:hypothetical protein KBX37_16970, partial [Micromonospora sp. U56]|uniref:hypothetical protein n=1 Tax=Micromonospora sp. U56 TaxID=2824900 RepID=UPI001B367C23
MPGRSTGVARDCGVPPGVSRRAWGSAGPAGGGLARGPVVPLPTGTVAVTVAWSTSLDRAVNRSV